jgi:hypothetical protein
MAAVVGIAAAVLGAAMEEWSMDRLKWIIASALVVAGGASASITACTGQAIAVLQSIADSGNTPANGCGSVEVGFSGFLVGSSSIVAGQNITGPSASNIDIAGSGLSYSLSSTGWTTGSPSTGSETLGSQIALLASPTDAEPIDGLALSIAGFDNKGSVVVTEIFCLGASSAAGCNASNEGSLDIQEQFGTTVGPPAARFPLLSGARRTTVQGRFPSTA